MPRDGTPTSVADGRGVCAVRQADVEIARTRRRMRWRGVSIDRFAPCSGGYHGPLRRNRPLQAEPPPNPRYVLPPERVLPTGEPSALVQRQCGLLHQVHLHVRREREAEAIAQREGEIGVEGVRRELRARLSR